MDINRNVAVSIVLIAGVWAIYAVFTNDIVAAIVSSGALVCMFIDEAERSIVKAIKGRK